MSGQKETVTETETENVTETETTNLVNTCLYAIADMDKIREKIREHVVWLEAMVHVYPMLGHYEIDIAHGILGYENIDIIMWFKYYKFDTVRVRYVVLRNGDLYLHGNRKTVKEEMKMLEKRAIERLKKGEIERAARDLILVNVFKIIDHEIVSHEKRLGHTVR